MQKLNPKTTKPTTANEQSKTGRQAHNNDVDDPSLVPKMNYANGENKMEQNIELNLRRQFVNVQIDS